MDIIVITRSLREGLILTADQFSVDEYGTLTLYNTGGGLGDDMNQATFAGGEWISAIAEGVSEKLADIKAQNLELETQVEDLELEKQELQDLIDLVRTRINEKLAQEDDLLNQLLTTPNAATRRTILRQQLLGEP